MHECARGFVLMMVMAAWGDFGVRTWIDVTRIHSYRVDMPRETNQCYTSGSISQQLLEYLQNYCRLFRCCWVVLDTYFIFLQSTGKRSALGTVREAELYGGVLSSSLSREHLALTAEFLRGDEYVLGPNSLPHF
jgi:hypothetical protein